MNQERDYVSYLLRLWQVGGSDESIWRATLESPRTGKQHSFASLTDLFAFLAHEIVQQEVPLQDNGPAIPEA